MVLTVGREYIGISQI